MRLAAVLRRSVPFNFALPKAERTFLISMYSTLRYTLRQRDYGQTLLRSKQY